jgi:hypothetical protein
MPCQSHKPGDECEDVCARSCYARKDGMSSNKESASESEREAAPHNSLPDWYECQRILDNADFRKRAEAGLEGQVLATPPSTPEPTELHRFIYEYDDADPHRSAWFLHQLELVLKEARTAGVALGGK